MNRLSFSLPKYDYATQDFCNCFGEELHLRDEVLRSFPPIQVAHSGTTRFLSKPNVLEEPYRLHTNRTSAEIEVVTNTDVPKLKEFLLELLEPIIKKARDHTDEIINQTCVATGNSVDTKNQNIWDAYIEAIEKVEMGFDDEGNPIFLLYPPAFHEKLSETEPTIEQWKRVEEIFDTKRKEYFSKKSSRKLQRSNYEFKQINLNAEVDVNSLKTFLSLPKYNFAISKFIRDVKEGFVSLDPILGEIRSVPVSHGGVTRQVSEPQIFETPMKKYSVEVSIDLEWFCKTDSEQFRDFLWKFAEEVMSQMKKHFFNTIPLICDAVGNSIDAKGKNFWDAYFEMLETTQMHFDENGNHNYKFFGHPDMFEKLQTNPPSPEQVAKEEEIIERKKKEYYAKKRTRRLS